MASQKGSVATETPLLTSTAPQHPLPSIDDPVPGDSGRKSLKRAREVTPTSPAAAAGLGDLSPSKIARLAAYTKSSIAPPLTGAAALEDERRLREEELRQNPPGTSDNPSRKVLQAMSAAAEMSRLEDAPASATDSARPRPPSVIIPATNVISASIDDTSPHSVNSSRSLASATGEVVHSPTEMDVDSQNDRLYPPQPDAPMDDKSTSFSYPGLSLPASMRAPARPQRGMSLPQEGDGTRPAGKKHKCPYCATEFTRHHNLKSHLLTHSQEKPYVCQTCNLRFRRLHDLKRHTKLHTGEKPHICPKCDRKFARGDALARHSKGAGGCAGRRSSMGSFGGDDDFEGNSGMDDSVMSGVVYEGNVDSVTEEERRRRSLPTVKPQLVAGQSAPEGLTTHSSTYPPLGQRITASGGGGLYPPSVDRGASSSNTSPSGPSSHTPHTSVSSVPLSAGSSSVYGQGGVTESPKPLSPSGTRQRSPKGDHGVPSHGKTTQNHPAYQAWVHAYPPANGNSAEGNAPAGSSASRQRAGSKSRVTAAALGRNSTGGAEPANKLFAAGEHGMWSYVQHLDETVKVLSSNAEVAKQTEAQLLERLTSAERRVELLASEVHSLQQQLTAATRAAQPKE